MHRRVPIVAGLGIAGALAVLVALGILAIGDGASPTAAPETIRGDTEETDRPAVPLHTEAGSDPAASGPSLVGLPGAGARPSAPSTRDVVIRVVDAAGIPLAGQTVSVFVGDTLHAHVVTGSDGRVVLSDLPQDANAWAALGLHDGKPDVLVPVTGDTVQIRAAHVLELRVDVVDAETDAYLGHARWYFTTPELRGAMEAVASGEPTPIRVVPGTWLRRPFSVEPVPGYVDWDRPWTGMISRYATSLVVRHPLRREVEVVVQVVDEEGEDVVDAQVGSFCVGGQVDTSPQTGMYLLGGVPLRGVPFYPGQALEVWAGTPDGRVGKGEVRLPMDPHEVVQVDVVVKKQRLPAASEDVEFEVDVDLPYEESIESAGGAPAPLVGALEVEVLRADGRPALGARVHLPAAGEHRTDENGRIRVERILVGEYVVRLDEPGLVSCTEAVEVVGGSTAYVTLREPRGATLALTVKDAGGRPLPFVLLQVQQPFGTVWADVDPDGVQRLDPYTDEEGKRTLRRLQPGRIRVAGAWGALRGNVVVVIGDGETEEVILLLR